MGNKKKGDEKSASESKNEQSSGSLLDLHTSRGQILFVVITIAFSSLIQFVPIQLMRNTVTVTEPIATPTPTAQPTDHFINRTEVNEKVLEKSKPIFWTYGETKNENLKHVRYVLKRLGFEHGSNESDWDLLWAHSYPFITFYPQLIQLLPHQRVNHIPGVSYIASKNQLAKLELKAIPKAFKLPNDKQEFLEYANKYPEKLFVQKSNNHRQISIKSVNEIDYNRTDTFIQEFIDKPLLVDGYKFDLGVFVVITSINPLRVYIYKGDVLIRYCPVKYYPFDSKNVDKYVVAGNYLPTWNVPSLVPYYTGLGFGMKDSFDAYMKAKGISTENIWIQVEEAIRGIILTKEKNMEESLRPYKSKHNFFEMMRFDLMIDDKLNVYVLEANMSPSLSTNHFTQNAVLYEQVTYNVFNMLGIGSPLDRESFEKRDPDTESMVSSLKNIVVDADICAKPPCTYSCESVECQLCRPCLSSDDLEDLKMAYREHMNRGDTKRIFPVPIVDKKLNEKEFKLLSPKNQMMARWFHSKCVNDPSWCS